MIPLNYFVPPIFFPSKIWRVLNFSRKVYSVFIFCYTANRETFTLLFATENGPWKLIMLSAHTSLTLPLPLFIRTKIKLLLARYDHFGLYWVTHRIIFTTVLIIMKRVEKWQFFGLHLIFFLLQISGRWTDFTFSL